MSALPLVSVVIPARDAEAWIAAYRLTQEGRQFPGVTRSLRWAIGLPDRSGQRVAAVG